MSKSNELTNARNEFNEKYTVGRFFEKYPSKAEINSSNNNIDLKGICITTDINPSDPDICL